MNPTSEGFDFFVSYARKDNEGGWITAFVESLLEEHQRFTGGRCLTPFFDKDSIRGFDDWQHRIYHGVTSSRMFLAFLSPNYLASEWCRKEWKLWVDTEISKHILTFGSAPIYLVDIPGLVESGWTDFQVAQAVAELNGGGSSFAAQSAGIVRQLRRRELSQLQHFFSEGLESLRKEDLRKTLKGLAEQLDAGVDRVRKAAESESDIPPYNPRFSGRLEELNELRDRLLRAHVGTVTGICGLGGVGKSELAYTYAHAFASAYPGGRFHVPCEHGPSLGEVICMSLGTRFHQQISDEERPNLKIHMAAVRRCLSQRIRSLGPILLVLDNVDRLSLLSPGQLGCLTGVGNGLHLLATTRLAPGARKDWLHLSKLSEADAFDLLEKHRHLPTEADRAAGLDLVRKLDGFALTVELVGSWLEHNPEVDVTGLVCRLDAEGFSTLDELADGDVELQRHDHERKLGVILAQTLNGLTPPARRAMEFAAILPPEHIALPWLKELVGQDFPDLLQTPRPGHSDLWTGVQCELEGLGLLARPRQEGDGLVLSVHRLVRDHIFRGISEGRLDILTSEVRSFLSKRLHALQSSFTGPQDQWEWEALHALADDWSDTEIQKQLSTVECDKTDSELETFLSKITNMRNIEISERLLEAIWLYNVVTTKWIHFAFWEKAENSARRALKVCEKTLGPDSPEMATCLRNLARVLQDTNRLAEADPLMHEALDISERWLGPDHPDVASCRSYLARLYQDTNRPDDAIRLMRQTLDFSERSLGPDHPDVACDLLNLATLLGGMGSLAEAESLMRRALVISERSLGPDHPTVADCLNNLALLLKVTHRTAEAEHLMRRALEIREQILGPDHPRVGDSLNNLGLILRATNRCSEAVVLVRRALGILERSMGPGHPVVAKCLITLSRLLQEVDCHAEAEPLLQQAIEIQMQTLGPDYPELAADLEDLAMLLRRLHRYIEAEALMHQAREIRELPFGSEPPDGDNPSL